MSNFSWQTDDDSSWNTDDKSPHISSKQRHWRLWSVLALIVILAAWGVTTAIRHRVAQAETRLIDDVDSAVQTLIDAGNRGDAELFNLLLSGRNHNWSMQQLFRVRRGGWTDRSMLGLIQTDASAKTDITLATNLTSADVLAHLTYQTPQDTDITLGIPMILRKEDTQWLLAPPEIGHWGETLEIQLTYVTARYPAHDQAIVMRMLSDIDVALAELCSGSYRISCPTGGRIHLNFVSSAETLNHLSSVQMRTLPTDLPTPSVIGLPIDEASYRALLAAYTWQGLTPHITDWADYVCCDHATYYRALLDQLYFELGLAERGVSAERFNTTPHSNVTALLTPERSESWLSNDPTQLVAAEYPVVLRQIDFLRSRYQVSLFEMMRSLNEADTDNFDRWLQLSMLETNLPRLRIDDFKLAFLNWFGESARSQQ